MRVTSVQSLRGQGAAGTEGRRYLVLASKVVRPNQVYRVSVTLLSAASPHTVRASLQRGSEEVASAKDLLSSGETAVLLMKVY
ncbi:hypothetical protein IscW_ISCW003090 [Ixodes scapularis]|uniref:Uncharacterized protein n=1 Tax=Ixodes scapularis TaxID=6945 RepID=B7PCZ7_IXOSC|nr:hypothetical protein IscW_ISCW003090 [Ixodes scapularis]|eukprot:XP_002410474.1 hypothetical protein IscW_ISCW003090 [Ixodes scapularis]